MTTANPTIFKFYLVMMDYFSEYLSKKYSDSSLEHPHHYKTIIIKRTVRMFHTLDLFNQNKIDEASALCLLRGILDSVAIYYFIYHREDKNEVLFRHYLYALDGFKTYKNEIIEKIEKESHIDDNTRANCDTIIRQIENKIAQHPYSNSKCQRVFTIINNANWKYVSLNNTRSVTYLEMYKYLGICEEVANYYHCYLSQYSHGLCLSNRSYTDVRTMTNFLQDSISIEQFFIKAITQTFCEDNLFDHLLNNLNSENLLTMSGFNLKDFLDYAKAVINHS